MSKTNTEGEPSVEFRGTNSAFANRIREFELVNNGFKNIEEFLVKAFEIYPIEIGKAVTEYNLIKTLSYFSAEFERSFHIDEDSDVLFEKREIHIPTIVRIINTTTDLREHYQKDIIEHIVKKVQEVMVEGSGFTLSRINQLRVQICKYEPLRGAGLIELPKALKNKRSIINLKNTYDECFKWSILAALHYDEVYTKNRNKVNDAASYRFWANELNFNEIDFPMRLDQIEKFDLEKKCICPCFLASKSIGKTYVHLLMITEATPTYDNTLNVNANSHYCWIKNLSALVGMQMSKHEHKKWICDRCLIHFNSQDKLNKHKSACETMNECAIVMPTVGSNYEKFTKFKNQLKIPFIVYADTEALLKEPEKLVFSSECLTQAHQEHEVHSIGYYFKHENDESKSYYASCRSVNCIDWFLHELKTIAETVFNYLEDKKPMHALTEEEVKIFVNSTICHICKKAFANTPAEIRVRDHCHSTGVYRGPAHQSCNLNYQISRNIPVVMHNLSGYDSHLLIRKLGAGKQLPGEITIIPYNSEKYISFIKEVQGVGSPNQNQIKFKFIDSLRFMTASLDSLAALVPSEKKLILKSECMKSGFRTDEMFNLLNRKGVFPYEYIKYEKLEEMSLPAKECFYSKLNGSGISDEDYVHARNVWEKFEIRTLGEYSDLYLKTDVLLLADVFENFRNTCHGSYMLDPAHYFGAPGLSLDAMLKYTGVSIELFTDVDMLMFAENGIRGGVCQVNKRYVKANNQYMDADFDRTKETSYLLYLDGKYA